MAQRHTVQRDITLDALRKLKQHATADQVYGAVALEHANIGRATVYRNLNQLADDGEIVKIATPTGADCYDLRLDRHAHARCSRCGRVFDIELSGDAAGLLIKAVSDAHGFKIKACDFMFNGLCPECQNLNLNLERER